MFNWAKQQLANVAGTQEPIYGPSAIKSVAEQAAKTPYTEIEKDHLKWETRESTSVESQVFYLMGDNGRLGLAQVIYSNVAGIRTTVQFNAKVFSTDPSKPHLWSTTPIEGVDISEDGVSFYANDVAVELSAEGDSYTIKSLADENCIVNLKVTRTCPGVVAGTDGQTHYGTDMSNPWGNMRHRFWPRCRAEGTMTTKEEGPVDFSGRAMFVHAIQGMKPHHAAARWNFVDFQGPTYSAVMMEFTTPPSYGSTVVNVGIVAKDGEIVAAGCSGKATHVTTITGEADEWPAPKTAKFEWVGKTKEGKEVSAIVEGDLGERTDCVDIMSEVPGFVKKIVGGVVGTKPYIYQYSPKGDLDLVLKIGDETVTEKGIFFHEATFISEI